jgi:hypothetical protein
LVLKNSACLRRRIFFARLSHSAYLEASSLKHEEGFELALASDWDAI